MSTRKTKDSNGEEAILNNHESSGPLVAVEHSIRNFGLAVSGLLFLSCGGLCVWRTKPRTGDEIADQENSICSGQYVDSFARSEHQVPPTPMRPPPSPLRTYHSGPVAPSYFSLQQIVKATNNFSDTLKIGDGGFGDVYKCQLQNGQIFAVKRAKKGLHATLEAEFNREVAVLARIEHRNLVRLLGFIDEGDEKIIVSEYIPNGTLRDHLDGVSGKFLSFSQRLEIAIDVAHALTYLHSYSEKPIIHRDVKSSNILLTENLRAKVSDFGFAKTSSGNEDETSILTTPVGTAGYLDPEYAKTNKLTAKSDVFSYGVVMLEIFSGRRPVEPTRPHKERITVRWAFDLYRNKKFRDILDPSLEAPDGDILEYIFDLVVRCIGPIRSQRPTMKEVQMELWEIRKEYQQKIRSV